MRHVTALFIISLLGLLSALIACDRAPNGIIKESKMEKVLIDMAKADAYIGMNPDKFPNDSTRMVLKQSVLAAHGYTIHDFDTSLVWYAHNLDIYDKVLQNATKELRDEVNKKGGTPSRYMGGADLPQMQRPAAQHKQYANNGDTANVWKEQKTWVLAGGNTHGHIPFDLRPDQESRSGDRYQLQLKTFNAANRITVLLAVDYSDGTTSFVANTMSTDGWKSYDLQADTARIVKRVYGSIGYQITPGTIAFLDSIQLLRTHFDPQRFTSFRTQKILKPRDSDAAESRPQVFTPKEGVNKSSTPSRPTIPNPNAQHLPRTSDQRR